MTTILFKKLNKNATAPMRAHDGDAGFDVTAVSKTRDGGTFCYGTGLAFAIPKGYWMQACCRSSIWKHGLWLSNGFGVIDSGYRGEVKYYFYPQFYPCKPYEIGKRIGQLIVMPCKCDDIEFVEVDELPESFDGRGTGGFGSTGV